MEASTLLRAFKPFNFKLTKSIPIRCSSISSVSTIHAGNEGKLKRAYDGLLLDAGGTLLQLSKPVAETYLTIGQKYGLQSTAADIKLKITKHGVALDRSIEFSDKAKNLGADLVKRVVNATIRLLVMKDHLFAIKIGVKKGPFE